MTTQRNPEPPAATLEERVHMLEERITALAEAIRVLARGLEDVPTIEPGQRTAAEAARRAHDLLLLAEPRPPNAQAGAAHPGTSCSSPGCSAEYLAWRAPHQPAVWYWTVAVAGAVL